MLSVWKLMGGVGVILSICWMPAWIAEISLSSPSKSSMALARAAGEAEAPSGKVAALEGMASGACREEDCREEDFKEDDCREEGAGRRTVGRRMQGGGCREDVLVKNQKASR